MVEESLVALGDRGAAGGLCVEQCSNEIVVALGDSWEVAGFFFF